jgi:putative ABC transport system permease protein
MFILTLVLKNALRHKLRTMLTILGIAVAVMSFGFMRTIVTAWSAGVEASAANRMITRHSVSFIFPLPYA